MTITSVTVRRHVPDLDAAITFYERLTGEPATRFAFAGLELAATGPFLVFTGPPEAAARFSGVAATLGVEDVDATFADLIAHGAEPIAEPTPTPNGRRAVLRHPDGAVFEYVSR
ncbi:VOC family protein [Embleya sp. NBC_00888]|uniref:VOC family protein n=1 Tax=Embleya sp. NBC_00888 TaxID=2975960 RepID=UPI00386FBCE1|nr:VOC family protein [Embleya sp. NBC_00888]